MAVTINVLNAGNMILGSSGSIPSEGHWAVSLPQGKTVNLYGTRTNASNDNMEIEEWDETLPAKMFLQWHNGDEQTEESGYWSFQLEVYQGGNWGIYRNNNYAYQDYSTGETLYENSTSFVLQDDSGASDEKFTFTWIP